MDKKTLLGGLAGGIAFFFLGWLIYGILLMDYMGEHTMAGLNKSESEMMSGMIWMVISNLVLGYFFSLIFSWSNVSSVKQGFIKGAIIGLLISIGYDLSNYAISNMYDSGMPYFVDIIAVTVMGSISGAIIAYIRNIVSAKSRAFSYQN